MSDVNGANSANTIHVPTDDTGSPKIRSLGTLARRGMRILGTQTDKTVYETALEGVERAVSDINMNHLFDFTTTVQTDTTLVEDQLEYELPSDLYAPREMLLVKASETPDETRPLVALDWDQFQRLFNQGGTGIPQYWLVRDAWIKRAVEVWPAPDAAAVNDYVLRMFYHKRITSPPLNDENVQIAGPKELAEVIVSYVRYHLLMTYDRDNRFAIGQTYAEYKQQLGNLKGAENRTKAAAPRIRIEGMRGSVNRLRGWPVRWRL